MGLSTQAQVCGYREALGAGVQGRTGCVRATQAAGQASLWGSRSASKANSHSISVWTRGWSPWCKGMEQGKVVQEWKEGACRPIQASVCSPRTLLSNQVVPPPIPGAGRQCGMKTTLQELPVGTLGSLPGLPGSAAFCLTCSLLAAASPCYSLHGTGMTAVTSLPLPSRHPKELKPE